MKLILLISGQAKVVVDPVTHSTQYSRLYPLKLPENEEVDIIKTWIE